MDYKSFWEAVKVKGIEIGLEVNYFTHFENNETQNCKLSNVGLKRCSYYFDISTQAGCFIKLTHTNADWNKKIYEMVLSCKDDLEQSIGVPMEFNAEELSVGICAHPKDHSLEFIVGKTSEEELSIHLIRCFYLMLEEVDHVFRNSMDEAY